METPDRNRGIADDVGSTEKAPAKPRRLRPKVSDGSDAPKSQDKAAEKETDGTGGGGGPTEQQAEETPVKCVRCGDMVDKSLCRPTGPRAVGSFRCKECQALLVNLGRHFDKSSLALTEEDPN